MRVTLKLQFIGERRVMSLKEGTSVDTEFSSKHNLALARRDGGQVAEALEMFLEGEALADVLTSRKTYRGKRIGVLRKCRPMLVLPASF